MQPRGVIDINPLPIVLRFRREAKAGEASVVGIQEAARPSFLIRSDDDNLAFIAGELAAFVRDERYWLFHRPGPVKSDGFSVQATPDVNSVTSHCNLRRVAHRRQTLLGLEPSFVSSPVRRT